MGGGLKKGPSFADSFVFKKSNNIICGCRKYMTRYLKLCRKTGSSNFVSKTFARFSGMSSCYSLKIVHSPIREKLI